MANDLTIGILGGMGPEGTNQLCALITAFTPVEKDQDHIPVITYNNPRIPSRVSAIRGEGESPVPEMVRTALVLQHAGADFLVLPCNLAHAYLEDVRRSVQIPILNMIDETVTYIVTNHPECRVIGLIASTATLECGLYEDAFRRHDQRLLIRPSEIVQESNVMVAIYGRDGIKSGHKTKPRTLLMEAAHSLIKQGADLIIAGCTEVSVVMNSTNSPFSIVDPLEVIARVAIRMATRGAPATTYLTASSSGQS